MPGSSHDDAVTFQRGYTAEKYASILGFNLNLGKAEVTTAREITKSS